MPKEPEIIINGIRLSDAQATSIRVAVSIFDPDCGDSEQGRAVRRNYRDRIAEINKIMFGNPPTPGR